MVVIIGRAFLKAQRLIHAGAVRVPGLESAVCGAFDHDVFIVVNILRDGPVDVLLDSSAEGIVGVADGCRTLGDLLQTGILKNLRLSLWGPFQLIFLSTSPIYPQFLNFLHCITITPLFFNF